jgi:hypothetical protein
MDPSIPLQVQVPTLSQAFAGPNAMLSMAQGLQSLQQSRQQVESQNIQLQSQRQANDERQSLMRLMQDPDSGVFNPDGSPNLEVAQKKILQVAPQTGPDVINKLTQLSSAHSNATQAKMNLNSAGRAQVSGLATALDAMGASPTQAAAAFKQLSDDNPDDPHIKQLADSYGTTLGMMPPDTPKDAMSKALKNLRAQLMSPQDQQATYAPTAGQFSNGAQSFPVATNPNRADYNATIGQPRDVGLLPAPSQNVVGTGPTGNPTVMTRDPYGRPTGIQNVPGAQGPVVIPPNESSATLPEVQQIRTAANTAAKQVPQLHQNAQEIQNLADQIPKGAAGNWWSTLSSKLGYNLGNDDATARQRLKHYMALQTSAAAQAMGADSVHAQQTAEAAGAGNEDWTPSAIKSTSKVFDAYATGMANFNNGLESYLSSPNNQAGPWGARTFQNAWSANFDPTAMQVVNALKSGDKAELAELNKRVTPDIKRKALNLAALIRGQIPQ